MNERTKQTDDELLRLITAAEATIAVAKKNVDQLKAELLIRRKDEIAALLKAKDEPFGDVKIIIGNYQVKVATPKKVKYDQTKLKTIAAQMAKEDVNPELYMKVEYDISETVYKGWPQEMKDYFADARSIEPGSVSIKIVEGKE